MEDLRVEIPKKFKRSLERRFDLKRVKCEMFGDRKLYFIKGRCELCLNYFSWHNKCVGCPFGKFRSKNMVGCIHWIEEIIGLGRFYFAVSDTDINWWGEYDNEAREQIKKLVKEAKKLITWI